MQSLSTTSQQWLVHSVLRIKEARWNEHNTLKNHKGNGDRPQHMQVLSTNSIWLALNN